MHIPRHTGARSARIPDDLLSDTHNLLRSFDRCKSKAELARVMDRASAHLGATSHVVGILPNGIVRPRDQPNFVLSGSWPQEWASRYFAGQFAQDDPAIEHARTQLAPIRWENLRYGQRGRNVMDRASEHGLRDGITAPQYTFDGLRIVVSLAGDRIDDAPEARTAFLFLAATAANRGMAIAQASRDVPRVQLTPRERECLLWLIEGKTDWEISVILNVSRRSIERHMANLRSKLGAASRVQAVVAAFRSGLIG